MVNSLVWAGIRQHRGSLIGVFIAILAATVLVTGLGALIESGLRGGVDPERYIGADVIVGGKQSVPVAEDLGISLLERAPLQADVVASLSDFSDVAKIVVDWTTPLLWGTAVVEAHPWSAAALTPYQISSGRAPAADNEVVVDAVLAPRTAIGERIVLAHGGVNATYEIVGIAGASNGDQPVRAHHVFVADSRAGDLSADMAGPAVIGVFAKEGVSTAELAKAITQRFPGVTSYTGNERGDAEFLDAGAAGGTLVVIAASFAGTALLLAVFVLAGTLSLSIQSRRRDFALLRAIGATPGQIHRLVCQEVLVVSGLAAITGVIPGYFLAEALRLGFARAGVIPPDFALTLSLIPAVLGIVVVVVSALLAATVAARRPAQINPVEALHEASTTPSGLSQGRIIMGVLLGLGGIAACTVPLFIHGPGAIAGPASAALLLIIAVALLGPRIVHGAVWIFGGPLRRSKSPAALLAATNSRNNSRRLAAAIIPLALGIGLGLVQVGTQSIVATESKAQSHDGVIAELMVRGGPSGISAQALSSIEGTRGVLAANPVVISQIILNYSEFGDPASEQYPAQGVDPAASATTLDLDIASGSLDQLAETGTVALSKDVAQTVGARVGDTVRAVLGDGTPITSRVVATYVRGLGFGDVTVSNEVLRAHTTTGLNNYVLVHVHEGAQEQVAKLLGASGFTVSDQGELRAAGEQSREANSVVNLIALLVILGYIAIAVVNTLIMATGERRREFALLQLIGATRGQVRAMMGIESMVVAVIAAVLGTFVAILPLVGISLGISGQIVPSVSPAAYIAIVGTLTVVGLLALAAGTRSTMRAAPITEIGSRE